MIGDVVKVVVEGIHVVGTVVAIKDGEIAVLMGDDKTSSSIVFCKENHAKQIIPRFSDETLKEMEEWPWWKLKFLIGKGSFAKEADPIP